LLPLIFLLIAVGIFAFMGYHIYLSFCKISDAASSKLEAKNVVFTKDGMRVGVKEVKTESYVDSTQNMLVKAWNLSTWPAYKSRLGWNKQKDDGVKARKPYVYLKSHMMFQANMIPIRYNNTPVPAAVK
jgi:hypothetical protein